MFFYFVIAGFCGRKNLASLTHVTKTNSFFINMYREVISFQNPSKDREIATAYMSGFLGHFFLDANTHPYIYNRTDYQKKADATYFGRHVFLETDIDRLLLERYSGLVPSRFDQGGTIRLTKEESLVVTRLLYEAYKNTYPDVKTLLTLIRGAIIWMPVACRLLQDSSGCKKAWLRKAEEIFLGYPLVSPLIASDTLQFYRDPLNLSHKKWSNPWDKTIVSNDSYMDLFDKAGNEYLVILQELNHLLLDDHADLPASFLHRLGNRSYHSGLDCRIPS